MASFVFRLAPRTSISLFFLVLLLQSQNLNLYIYHFSNSMSHQIEKSVVPFYPNRYVSKSRLSFSLNVHPFVFYRTPSLFMPPALNYPKAKSHKAQSVNYIHLGVPILAGLFVY